MKAAANACPAKGQANAAFAMEADRDLGLRAKYVTEAEIAPTAGKLKFPEEIAPIAKA